MVVSDCAAFHLHLVSGESEKHLWEHEEPTRSNTSLWQPHLQKFQQSHLPHFLPCLWAHSSKYIFRTISYRIWAWLLTRLFCWIFQQYFYEYIYAELQLRPRHVYPYAVVSFQFKGKDSALPSAPIAHIRYTLIHKDRCRWAQSCSSISYNA